MLKPKKMSNLFEEKLGNPIKLSDNIFEQRLGNAASYHERPGSSYRAGLFETETNELIDKSNAANSFWGMTKNAVKSSPKAVWNILTQNPAKTAASYAGGVADFGSNVVKIAGKIYNHTLAPFLGQSEFAKNIDNMPKYGTAFNEYIGNISEIQKNLQAGFEMGTAYATGEAVVGAAAGAAKTLPWVTKLATKYPKVSKLAFNSITRETAADLLGGQLVLDPGASSKERLEQAKWDILFGVPVTVSLKGMGRVFNKWRFRKAVEENLIPKAADDVPTTADVLSQPQVMPEKIEPMKVAEKLKQYSDETIEYKSRVIKEKDANGNAIKAYTEVDPKTGKATIVYDKSLDRIGNERTRSLIIGHEQGHVLSTRLSGVNEDLMPKIADYEGNMVPVDRALSDFAYTQKRTVKAIADDIKLELDNFGTKGNYSENFANVVAMAENAPDVVAKEAPTTWALLNYTPKNKTIKSVVTEADVAARADTTIKSTADDVKPAKQAEVKAGEVDDVAPTQADLIQEAKKYKSAEEFVKAQGTSVYHGSDKLFTTTDDIKFGDDFFYTLKRTDGELKEIAENVTADSYYSYDDLAKMPANAFGENVSEFVVKFKNPKIIDAKGKSWLDLTDGSMSDWTAKIVDQAKKSGGKYDGIIIKNIEEGFSSKGTLGASAGLVDDYIVLDKSALQTKSQLTDIWNKANQAKREVTTKFASTGLDTGKRIEGKSSFNPNTMNAPDDVEIMFGKLDAANKNFSGQRISKSNQDLKDMAHLLNVDPDELAKMAPGTVATGEVNVAVRQAILNKVDELNKWIQARLSRISAGKLTKEEAEYLKDQMTLLTSMQQAAAGLRSEASHSLRSWGVKLTPEQFASTQELAQMMAKLGFGDEAADLVTLSRKVAKEGSLTKFQKVGQGLLSTWYSSILSGPATHARNILSASGNIVTEFGNAIASPKRWKELPGMFSALIDGARNVVPAGKKAWAEGVDKLMMSQSGKLKPKTFTGKFEKFGNVVESVGRMLAVEDEVLSQIASKVEKSALRSWDNQIDDAVAEAMSHAFGESTLFHGTPKGKFWQGLVKGANSFTNTVPVAKIILPFTKIVGNVMDRSFDYLPFTSLFRLNKNFIASQVDDIVIKYALPDSAREIIAKRLFMQQVGRATTGLAVSAATIPLVAAGRISGAGPSNYSQRLQLEKTGWRRFSIKVGDTWVPYYYLGPLSGIFAFAGAIADAKEYNKSEEANLVDIAIKGVQGFAQAQLKASFLTGVADILDVLNDTKNGSLYLNRLAANLTPIPAAYSQTIDIGSSIIGKMTGDKSWQQQYETRHYADMIRQKLGLTGEMLGMDPLLPRRDQFGDPILADLIYGITPKKQTLTKLDKILIANDIIIARPTPNRKYSIPYSKEKRALTAKEYDKYLRVSGQNIYDQLQKRASMYERMTAEQIKKDVEKVVNKEREQVRLAILRNR